MNTTIQPTRRGAHRHPGSNRACALQLASALLVLTVTSPAVHAQANAISVPAAAELNLPAGPVLVALRALAAQTGLSSRADDPFQYPGGIRLAVRHLDGKAPELYVSNLRGAGGGRVEGAARFLAKEMATRNFHPGHVQGLMAEGHAGTLQVLDGINNFAGWQRVAREVVRHDQRQEFMDVHVRDKHQLGLEQRFVKDNPHALAQSIERMLEAAPLKQWDADPRSGAELKARYNELAKRYNVRSDNAVLQSFLSQGFGPAAPKPTAATPVADAPATVPAAPSPPPQAAPRPPPVQGLKLARAPDAAAPAMAVVEARSTLLALALALAGGVRREWRWGPTSGSTSLRSRVCTVSPPLLAA